MKKINELYGLENISDCYYITDNSDIININTNRIKTQTLGKRGYLYVTLNDKQNKQCKVYIHKIVALAFISNEPYEAINHIDGNKLNNTINNLEFCTKKYNTQHAFANNLIQIHYRIFEIKMMCYPFMFIHKGSMKDLSNMLNIPIKTLYCIFYNKTKNNRYGILSIEEVDYI